MILLPRGNPVKEGIDPGRVNLPEAMRKLQVGGFTGYLRFETPQGTGIIIFRQGRLISALYENDGDRFIAYDAIARAFEQALFGKSRLDIYRLSNELALSIHALLHGHMLYKAQELKLIDIRALLGKMKENKMTGCLRIYTEDRIALIFYQEGSPLGFFHDGSTDIEKTADTSMSVAKLPGAKVDILSASVASGEQMADLMESADLRELWERAKDLVLNERRNRKAEVRRAQEAREKQRRQGLLQSFAAIGERHIGKIGISLVEKELEKVEADFLTEGALSDFYVRLVRAAKLVAGPSKVNAMVEEMKQGAKQIVGSD